MPRAVATAAALAVLLLGCATTSIPQRQPEALDDGVQATGRIGGARVAISDAAPETNLDDCDPNTPDADVCWIARTIDGLTIAFVIENPGALVAGERIAVRDDTCTDCDDVTDHAVVDLRIGTDQRRAVRGRLTPSEVGERYAASFDVTLSDGDSLTGEFNIRRLAPEEQ